MGRHGIAQPALGHAGAPLNRDRWKRRGASLVELLTSMLFLSILSAMSYSFTRAALTSARVQEVKSEAQEVTVMALDVLTRELRMAGVAAPGATLVAVRRAEPEHIEVASDLNGDGDVADSNELIAYSYDAGKQQIMRATGGGSPQPLVRNVPPGGLQFAYLDAGGTPLSTVDGGLSEGDRRRIARIDVLVSASLASPVPGRTAALASTVTSSVYLRNHGGRR